MKKREGKNEKKRIAAISTTRAFSSGTVAVLVSPFLLLLVARHPSRLCRSFLGYARAALSAAADPPRVPSSPCALASRAFFNSAKLYDRHLPQARFGRTHPAPPSPRETFVHKSENYDLHPLPAPSLATSARGAWTTPSESSQGHMPTTA